MPSDTLRAVLWMIGSLVSFVSMAVAGRAVLTTLDTFEIMLYRSLTGVIIVVSLGLFTGHLREVKIVNLRHHAVRNMAHFAGQNLWFLAISMAPLAQVFAVEFTAPLWVLVLAPLILGETVRRVQLAVAGVGFAGVLLIAQPFSGTPSPGLIWVAFAAFAFALTNVLTRKLTRNETVTGILFWLTVLQLLFGLVCAGVDGDVALPTAATAPWLVLIGFAGLCAHWCLTNALRLAPASTIMPIDFGRLPLAAAVGTLLYAEPLDPAVLAGGLIVFGAAWTNIRLARQPAKAVNHVAGIQPLPAKDGLGTS